MLCKSDMFCCHFSLNKWITLMTCKSLLFCLRYTWTEAALYTDSCDVSNSLSVSAYACIRRNTNRRQLFFFLFFLSFSSSTCIQKILLISTAIIYCYTIHAKALAQAETVLFHRKCDLHKELCTMHIVNGRAIQRNKRL